MDDAIRTALSVCWPTSAATEIRLILYGESEYAAASRIVGDHDF